MSSRNTASTDPLKQKSLKSFFSKAPAVGRSSKAPKTQAPKPLEESVTSVSSASNANYKSDIPCSSSEIDPPKTPESRLTDLRALNSSAAGSTRSVTWSHKAGSTPPTSDPIPIEQDEDEDVVMLSSEKNHVTSIKSVSIYILRVLKEKNAETIHRVPVTNVKLSLMTRMTMTQRLRPMPDKLQTSEALRLPMQFEVRTFFYLNIWD